MQHFRPARRAELVAVALVLLVVFSYAFVYNSRNKPVLPPEMLGSSSAQASPIEDVPEDEVVVQETVVDPLINEAREVATAYFRPRIIQCGDSYYFYETNWLSEVKGTYGLGVTGAPPAQRAISLVDSLNGVRQSPLLWSGEVQVRLDAHHIAASEGGAIEPTSFQTDWKEFQTLTYKIEKHPSGWKVLTNLWEITCVDVERVLATGRRGRNVR
ncbi:MAG TPA: hypothetical protein VF006_09045 [Longimicrobium sp.]